MDLLILSIVYVLLVFSVYKIYFWFKGRKNSKFLYKLIEVTYLTERYKLNIEKIGIKKITNLISFTNALIFTLAIMLSSNVDNFIIRMLIMFVLLFPLIFAGYELIGRFYAKKGMTKNV